MKQCTKKQGGSSVVLPIKIRRLNDVENHIIFNYLNARVVVKKIQHLSLQKKKKSSLKDQQMPQETNLLNKLAFKNKLESITFKPKVQGNRIRNNLFGKPMKKLFQEDNWQDKDYKKKVQQNQKKRILKTQQITKSIQKQQENFHHKNKIKKNVYRRNSKKREKINNYRHSFSFPPLDISTLSKQKPQKDSTQATQKDINSHQISSVPYRQKIIQWRIIDPFAFQTQFFILNKTLSALKNESHIQHSNEQEISVPSRQNLTTFIKSYHTINPQIMISALIKNNKFQVHYQPQQLYFGLAKQNKRHGLGVLIKSNTIMEGKWENDQIVSGKQRTPFGVYTGKFYNRLKHGQGEFEWVNGEFYSGEWANGKKHGSGFWRSKQGDSYVGEWKHGQVEGQGIHITHSKQKYQGEFKQFLKHGWGKETFPNGDSYQGYYVKGKPHGTGCYKWKVGLCYQGVFKQGERHGKGCLKNCEGFNYIGDFAHERATGLGQITYADGTTYVGCLENGKKQGKGVLKIKKENVIYDGSWDQDQFTYTND